MRLIVASVMVCYLSFISEGWAEDRLAVTGSARVRAESRNNHEFSDAAGDMNNIGSRFRVELEYLANEHAHVFFQPQFTKTWGQSEFVGSSATANTKTGTSGGTRDSGVNAHQAYFRYEIGSNGGVTIGRKELNIGDELLIGGLGWSHVGRSFDLIAANYRCEGGRVEAFHALVEDNNVSSAGSGDKTLTGLYSSYRISDYVQAVSPYFLWLADKSTLPASDVHAYGLTVKSPVGPWDYRLEGTFEHVNSATVRSSDEHQIDFELGFKWGESKPVRMAAEYFTASKNFEQFYPTGHKWLGFADLFSRRNIEGLRLGANAKLSEHASVSLDYHIFKRHSTDHPAYKYLGGSYGSIGLSEDIAAEWDLVLTTKVADRLTVDAGYSYVLPGEYLKDNGLADEVAFFYLQTGLTF